MAHDLTVRVAEALRAEGVAVPVDATVTFARALAAAPEQAYWAGRATLVRRPEDVADYDRAFASVMLGAPTMPASESFVEQPVATDTGPDGAGDGDDSGDGGVLRWSAVEQLRHKDLGDCTDEERAELHRLVAALRPAASLRPSRRRVRDRRPRPAGRTDFGRTVAAAVRHGGELGRFETTSAGERPRRLVVLLDVSGSMAPYARALARFAHAAVAARRRGHVEVFAMGTRLTRITRELSTHDVDEALARAADVVTDWDGGTRLGDGLRSFNETWGIRGMARGAIVVVLSDGWDRGDPALLGEYLGRLARVAHRIVWVNPLKASPGYAPLAGGMAAALPWIDDFIEGHAIASLDALAQLLSATTNPNVRSERRSSPATGPHIAERGAA